MTRLIPILALMLIAWDYPGGIHATIIVPEAMVLAANEAAAKNFDMGAKTLTCGLNATGNYKDAVTHRVSSFQCAKENFANFCEQLAALSKLEKPTLTTATTAAKTTWIGDNQTALKAAGIIVVVDKPDWRTWVGRAEETIKAAGLKRIAYPMPTTGAK